MVASVVNGGWRGFSIFGCEGFKRLVARVVKSWWRGLHIVYGECVVSITLRLNSEVYGEGSKCCDL
jgi:hypothetical protein